MDFNQHIEDYRDQVKDSISFVGANSDLILQVKADLIAEFVNKFLKTTPKDASILDVGCGIGLMDQLLVPYFKNITAIDVAEDVLKQAINKNPTVQHQIYDGRVIPFEEASFDIVVAICVMHHVPPEQWDAFMKELKRVVKPGGLVVVFEHNPLNPLTQIVVSRCEFDQDAVLLYPWKVRSLMHSSGLKVLQSRSILYFPWRGSFFRKIERVLGHVPFGGQYFLVSQK